MDSGFHGPKLPGSRITLHGAKNGYSNLVLILVLVLELSVEPPDIHLHLISEHNYGENER